MRTLVLKPKTARATKTLGNLPSIPKQWVVLHERQSVSFSDKEGPWYQVYPDIPQGDITRMYVNANDDNWEVVFN